MYRLALSAGHGMNTPGKRCLKSIDAKETREWFLNNRICSKIEEYFKICDGIEVKRVDDVTGVRDVPISERTSAANKFNADLYLSIHHNAGISGGKGGGIMVFTYLSVDKKTENLQKKFYSEAINKTGLKGNRAVPLGKQDLGECRMTKMPAILIECGFMDSVSDTPIILTEKFADDMAKACIEVIKSESLAIPKYCETDTSQNIIYRVRKSEKDVASQIGAFSDLNNAVSLAKKNYLNVYDSNGNCVWKSAECTSPDIKDNIETVMNNKASESDSDILFWIKKLFNYIVNYKKF